MTVRQSLLQWWLCWSTVLLAVWIAPGAAGQAWLPIPPAESPLIQFPVPGSAGTPAVSADEYLRQGQELEQSGRWADAVIFYEEAIRRFPQEWALLYRYQQSRLRVDVARRWRDGSYLATLETVQLSQAAEALNEALLKVQVHYVEPVMWAELASRTLRGVEIALGEPALWARYGATFDPAAVEALRSQWSQLVAVKAPADRYQTVLVLTEAARQAERRCGIPASAILFEALCSAASLLDIYSCYLTPQQLKEILSQIEGNFVGLGVELKGEDGALVIVRVIPGSPAEAAGLRPGDRIVAIGDQPTEKLPTEVAADLLQGPEGSLVDLKVVSPGQPPRNVSVRRRQVEVPSIEGARLLDPGSGVAYVRISTFQKSTPRELDRALWSLYYQGMRSLIIDLRGNPGGLLTSAVESADRFLERGVIVYTRGRNILEDCTYVAHEPGTWRVPLVVLVDGQSASAAEIFAGAIRDHRRGTLVGTPTYGKGSVQGIFPLNTHQAGLRLTTSRFYSPAGRPFTLEGVTPDVLLRQAARPVSSRPGETLGQEDYALGVAIQTARDLIAQRN
jgi:carboxyl-terminal processing protease